MGEILFSDLPRIVQLARKVLAADSFAGIERLGGLTNHTYHVSLPDGRDYVIRIPGEGTEEMIVRSDEKKSTALACRLGVDAKMLYFGEDGSKVTEYIPNPVTMSAELLHDRVRVGKMAELFRTIHTCAEDTGVPFDVFDMAANYERIIRDQKIALYPDYPSVKDAVIRIKKTVDASCEISLVPCHNDPLCENWVESDGRMYLIDWEYAGMNDGMWDLGDVSIEAGFDGEWDNLLLSAYLGSEPSLDERRHFLASKIYVDFLWTLWALTRVPYDRDAMQAWADERYARLKENIRQFDAL
ncbi:MAG: phosphotransferase [Clostridia bacterium]|nr:phosphotransferase [Clostridia bacterium]